MTRRSERTGAGRARRAALTAGLAGATLAGPAALAPARAQPPERRVPGDTARLDTVGINSPSRDGRQAAADSAARDSAIARQLRAPARAGAGSRLGPMLDRLRLTSVGASAGGAWPRRVDAAALYSVSAGYGALAPWFDLNFSVGFWRSSYSEGARRAFARSLGEYVGDSVRTPSVRASVFTFGVDGHWRPVQLTDLSGRLSFLRPFLSGGFAVHFPNAEGAPITGTFVESSLDGIAIGLSGGPGLDVVLHPNFQLTMLARYDLFNGTPYPSLRAGASYLFERRTRAPRPGAVAVPRGGA